MQLKDLKRFGYNKRLLIKWVVKQHLASPSANPLTEREIKTKRQERKGEEGENARSSMSTRTPKSSDDRRRTHSTSMNKKKAFYAGV